MGNIRLKIIPIKDNVKKLEINGEITTVLIIPIGISWPKSFMLIPAVEIWAPTEAESEEFIFGGIKFLNKYLIKSEKIKIPPKAA